MGRERYCGSGFELVLDVTVPPLGGELVEVPNVVSQVVEQNVDIPVHGGMVHAMSLFPALPAVSRSPAPVVESFSSAPAPAPMVEFFAPAPAVIPSLAPVEDYISPVHGLRPGQGSTVRGGAFGRGRSLQGWRVQFADSSGRRLPDLFPHAVCLLPQRIHVRVSLRRRVFGSTALASGSLLFIAGLPEEYRFADIPGGDPRSASAFSGTMVGVSGDDAFRVEFPCSWAGPRFSAFLPKRLWPRSSSTSAVACSSSLG